MVIAHADCVKGVSMQSTASKEITLYFKKLDRTKELLGHCKYFH